MIGQHAGRDKLLAEYSTLAEAQLVLDFLSDCGFHPTLRDAHAQNLYFGIFTVKICVPEQEFGAASERLRELFPPVRPVEPGSVHPRGLMRRMRRSGAVFGVIFLGLTLLGVLAALAQTLAHLLRE